MNRFKEALLTGSEFVRSYELVPARGARGAKHEALMDFVDQAQRSGLLHAMSLTDNPGGNPALCPDVLGVEIRNVGIDPIVHFACKDASRNRIESRAFALERSGMENILTVTGDYPVAGYRGLSKPVFDLDSVHLLHYLKEMNEGLEVNGRGTRAARLARTHFFLGAVVSLSNGPNRIR